MIGGWAPHGVSLRETAGRGSVHFSACRFQLPRKELEVPRDPPLGGGRPVRGGTGHGNGSVFRRLSEARQWACGDSFHSSAYFVYPFEMFPSKRFLVCFFFNDSHGKPRLKRGENFHSPCGHVSHGGLCEDPVSSENCLSPW